MTAPFDPEVVVVAAMAREVQPLARALSLPKLDRVTLRGVVRAWGDDRSTAAVVVVGVGPVAAARATTQLLEQIAPRRLLVVGVAGAIGAHLSVGDVLRPSEVVDARTGARFAPSHRPGSTDPERGGKGDHGATGMAQSHRGVLATCAEMGDATPPDAWAVDMETAAIARVCTEHGVPWDAIRAVSDVAGTVSPDIARLLGADGSVDAKRLAGLLVRSPRSVVQLVRIGVQFRRALQALTAAAIGTLRPS